MCAHAKSNLVLKVVKEVIRGGGTMQHVQCVEQSLYFIGVNARKWVLQVDILLGDKELVVRCWKSALCQATAGGARTAYMAA
ncbi:hypothetical protein HPP92_006200 [Vanilla planifolia]|uniref:Uncharacterized protein n=1 Tax=Vanilla planifolia TaxID=51239 RepID=A0A835VG42_VANPL|nr:hypothetical protein HPP92_006200 [Vanilla planifolia]